VSLGPVEPEAFRVFNDAAWSISARRRMAILAGGYALAAVGIAISFASIIRKRGYYFIGAMAAVAALGVGVVILMPFGSGLALDAATILINDDAPALVALGRIARLGPGRAPQLVAIGRMPPKILLYGRYSAAQRDWAAYRFSASGASIQPLLDIGQSVCVYSVYEVPRDYSAGMRSVDPPPNAARIILFFERQLATGVKHNYRWVEHSPFLFQEGARRELAQVQTAPTLVATPSK